MESRHIFGVQIHVQPTTAHDLLDEWEQQQSRERQLRRRLAINKIAEVLTEAKVCSDDSQTDALSGQILDSDLNIGANAVGFNVGTNVKGIVGEYNKISDHVYFFGNAPKENKDLSLEGDKVARRHQIENFKKIFIGTHTKKQVHQEQESYALTYDQLLDDTDTFVKTMAQYSCASSIFFNGHGSNEGIHFQEVHDPIPLNRYINDLNRLASVFNLKNVRLVFAQCYGHLYYPTPGVLSCDFLVHALSKQTNPYTFYIIKHDDGLTSTKRTEHGSGKITDSPCPDYKNKPIIDSHHLGLEAYAEQQNKEHVRESNILPGYELTVDERGMSGTTKETISEECTRSELVVNGTTASFTASAPYVSASAGGNEQSPVAETRTDPDSLVVGSVRSSLGSVKNTARAFDSFPQGEQIINSDRQGELLLPPYTEVQESDSIAAMGGRQERAAENVAMQDGNTTEIQAETCQTITVQSPNPAKAKMDVASSEQDDGSSLCDRNRQERHVETVEFGTFQAHISNKDTSYGQSQSQEGVRRRKHDDQNDKGINASNAPTVSHARAHVCGYTVLVSIIIVLLYMLLSKQL